MPIGSAVGYKPLTLAQLAEYSTGLDDNDRWRLVAEFLEDYRWEPVDVGLSLVAEEPMPTKSNRWDVFYAALAEHLSVRAGKGTPVWASGKTLEQFWFPFNTRAARVDAIVNSPAAFRRRGIFIAPQELQVA